MKVRAKESREEAVHIPTALLSHLVSCNTPVQFVSDPTILNIDYASRIPENMHIVSNIVVEA